MKRARESLNVEGSYDRDEPCLSLFFWERLRLRLLCIVGCLRRWCSTKSIVLWSTVAKGRSANCCAAGSGFAAWIVFLLTHGHLDHILGLGGIASTFGRWEAIDRLEIWGGRWALDRVERLMEVVFGTPAPARDRVL